VRLFVALDLPEAVRQAFRELISQLKKSSPNARWVRPEGIHVTLKFIGHTDERNLESICAALAPIRSEQPVEMEFRGLGFFPHERRPRVLWCAVGASANLARLTADIGRALEPLGMAAESREYVPHLTLARLEPERISPAELQKLERAAEEAAGSSFGSARESEFYLFESMLKPAGAEYRRVQAFPFVKGSV
jgi:RNA 2',3'-cyclic 3'-phosphodiesterase